jgi:hypothetical protein
LLSSTHPFSLQTKVAASDVVTVLQKYGVVYFDGLLREETVDRLTDECWTLFDDRAPWVNREEYSIGQAVRLVRKEIDRERYPAVLQVFEDPYLEEIVARHYGDGYVFAEKIYAILDVVGSNTIVQQLHYDKIQHLKIFFYLSDVGMEHGPFHCVPGSHVFCAGLQAENRRLGIIPTDDDTRVLPTEFREGVVPITGNRGTLIIFDSDIVHRAGVPTGGSRLAMRSLSFGPASLGKRV